MQASVIHCMLAIFQTTALCHKALVFGLALPGSPAPDLTTPHPLRCRGSTFMAPRQRAFAFFCLPIFRRRLTIWPVSLQLPPPQRWALGVSRLVLRWVNSTVVDFNPSTLVEIIVEIFVEVAEFPHDHTPHRRKKARRMRAGALLQVVNKTAGRLVWCRSIENLQA